MEMPAAFAALDARRKRARPHFHKAFHSGIDERSFHISRTLRFEWICRPPSSGLAGGDGPEAFPPDLNRHADPSDGRLEPGSSSADTAKTDKAWRAASGRP